MEEGEKEGQRPEEEEVREGGRKGRRDREGGGERMNNGVIRWVRRK